MKILLIGANGYLGARLFLDLRKKFEVIGTYHKSQLCADFIQLDITDAHQVQEVFEQYQPDIVIHPANHASPRPAANDPQGYQALNQQATNHIVSAANTVGAKVIFISSFAAITPGDIYGQLKVQSEESVKKTTAGYLIIRPSLILGLSPNTENDRPFNRVLKCLDTNTVGEFDTSWQFQPTYVGHVSAVIDAAIEKNLFNQTIHVTSPSVQTQYSTAEDILTPFGVTVKPVDKGLTLPLQECDEHELKALGLPTCSYQEMLTRIHEEIQNRSDYQL